MRLKLSQPSLAGVGTGAELGNKELKEEVLEMKKENEKLQAQSVEDAMDLADISNTNEDLVSIVTRGSTLDDVEESTDSSVV